MSDETDTHDEPMSADEIYLQSYTDAYRESRHLRQPKEWPNDTDPLVMEAWSRADDAHAAIDRIEDMVKRLVTERPTDPDEALLLSRYRALGVEARRIVLTLLEHLSAKKKGG